MPSSIMRTRVGFSSDAARGPAQLSPEGSPVVRRIAVSCTPGVGAGLVPLGDTDNDNDSTFDALLAVHHQRVNPRCPVPGARQGTCRTARLWDAHYRKEIIMRCSLRSKPDCLRFGSGSSSGGCR